MLFFNTSSTLMSLFYILFKQFISWLSQEVYHWGGGSRKMFSNFKMQLVKNCFKLKIGKMQMSQQEIISGRKGGKTRREKAHRHIHWWLVRTSETEMLWSGLLTKQILVYSFSVLVPCLLSNRNESIHDWRKIQTKSEEQDLMKERMSCF